MVDPALQVGGVQEHVGELHVGEGAGPERSELFVELGTDPADLGFRDAGLKAEGRHQVVDLPGRDPVHVGLHNHGEQGPVDPAPTFQDAREEAALAELGDLQIDVAGLGREQSVPGAVALGRAGTRPLESIGSDLGGRLGVDQGLEHHLDAPAHDVDVSAGADSVEQFVQVTIGNGHWVSPWLSLLVQPKITRWPPQSGGPPELHHSGGHQPSSGPWVPSGCSPRPGSGPR